MLSLCQLEGNYKLLKGIVVTIYGRGDGSKVQIPLEFDLFNLKILLSMITLHIAVEETKEQGDLQFVQQK